MKTLNTKNISLALIMTLGSLFSINASATSASTVETTVSEFVVTQSQQMIAELNQKLQKTIEQEINDFTIDFSFSQNASHEIGAEKIVNITAPVKDMKLPAGNKGQIGQTGQVK